jgi:hypothetical protein
MSNPRMRRPTNSDELIKTYYGGRGRHGQHRHRQASEYGRYRGHDLDNSAERLLTRYGRDGHAHAHRKPRVDLSFSVDDGAMLQPAAGSAQFEEYVVAASQGEDAFDEYVVGQAALSGQASLDSPALNAATDPQAEYLVDVADPFGGPGANRFDPPQRRDAALTSKPAVQGAPLAPAPTAQGETAATKPAEREERTQLRPAPAVSARGPAPAELAQEASRRTASDDDFISDMKAILSRQKIYDPVTKQAVDVDRLRQRASGEPRQGEGSPGAQSHNSQAIFDKIAQSMQYANKYDLGTVEMENRFADFDRMLDLQQKAEADQRAKRAQANQVAAATDVDSQDFIQDLDAIHHRRGQGSALPSSPSDDPFAFVPPPSLDESPGAPWPDGHSPGVSWSGGTSPGYSPAGASDGGPALISIPGIQIPEIRTPSIQISGLPVPGYSAASPIAASSRLTPAVETYARDFDAIEPFAEQPYGPQMIIDAARSKDLSDAIAAVKGGLSRSNQQRLDKVAFCIAKLGTGHNPVEYAGVKEMDMLFSGSLVKVALLYASFELRARLNKLAPSVAWDWKPFFAAVKSAIPWIPDHEADGKPSREMEMKIDDVVRIINTTDAGVLSYDLRPEHRADLEAIFADQLHNRSPQNVVHRLGYSWINGALAKAGFLDVKTKKGTWLGNDIGAGWRQVHVPVATGGKSSEATTAVDLVNLLTCMHRGTLIDAASSQEMMNIMARGGSWISTLSQAAQNSLSFVSTGAKVGHDGSDDAKVPSVKSEALFIDHRGTPFVAVWQNYPDASPNTNEDIVNVYRAIDETLKKWP